KYRLVTLPAITLTATILAALMVGNKNILSPSSRPLLSNFLISCDVSLSRRRGNKEDYKNLN
ncbi:hypothetical protein, partial [Citrobacter koseri]